MKKRRSTKLIHEGRYVAEVDIELLDSEEGWSPYLSLEDALKLDDVRAALRRGDLENAVRLSRVYTLNHPNFPERYFGRYSSSTGTICTVKAVSRASQES